MKWLIIALLYLVVAVASIATSKDPWTASMIFSLGLGFAASAFRAADEL